MTKKASNNGNVSGGYRRVPVLPHPPGPLARQQHVHPSELGAAGQRGHERRQVFGGEAVGGGRLLQGLAPTDVGDL